MSFSKTAPFGKVALAKTYNYFKKVAKSRDSEKVAHSKIRFIKK